MDFKQNFKRTVNIGILRKRNPEIPDGLMKRCKVCRSAVFVEEARQNLDICPRCGTYFRMHARRRIEQVLDEGSFEEWDTDLNEKNPLGYRGYPDKIADLREKTGLDEAVLTGKGRINGLPTVFGVCDSRFLMASMGEVVGEKITRAVERATKDRLPVIFFICSGGARMQEGMTSLMQMAKTAAAFRRHSDAGLLSVNVLTNPTTGGVTASFAGGYYSGGAWRSDRLCRSSGYRADHRPEAPGGLPELGISPGARFPRRDCGEERDEGDTAADFEAAWRGSKNTMERARFGKDRKAAIGWKMLSDRFRNGIVDSRSCFDCNCICHTSRPHLIPPPLPLHSLRPPHPRRKTGGLGSCHSGPVGGTAAKRRFPAPPF